MVDSCIGPEIWNTVPDAEVQGYTAQEPPPERIGFCFQGINRRFLREREKGKHQESKKERRNTDKTVFHIRFSLRKIYLFA